MKTLILSCFPGVGKTWVFDNQKELGFSVLDSDSSKFSWLSDGVRNPDFPQNYVDHIKEVSGTVDVILVSTHREVREALIQNGVAFHTVVPPLVDKELYIKRYRDRGSSSYFISLLSDNWDSWLSGIFASGLPCCEIRPGGYLSDVVSGILCLYKRKYRE